MVMATALPSDRPGLIGTRHLCRVRGRSFSENLPRFARTALADPSAIPRHPVWPPQSLSLRRPPFGSMKALTTCKGTGAGPHPAAEHSGKPPRSERHRRSGLTKWRCWATSASIRGSSCTPSMGNPLLARQHQTRRIDFIGVFAAGADQRGHDQADRVAGIGIARLEQRSEHPLDPLPTWPAISSGASGMCRIQT